MAGRRFTHTGHQRIAVVAYLAHLVAQDARTRGPAGPYGCHQLRVGDLRPGHLDRVGDAVRERRLRHVDVHHAALQDDRDGADAATIRALRAAVRAVQAVQRCPDRAGELAVEAGLHVHVRPGRGHREDRPADHHQVVVQPCERAGDLDRRRRGDTGPRSQLVAGQPQPDDRVPGRGAGGGQHLPREPQPVRAVVVAAGVRQARQELAHQAVLAGVHLHTVTAGGDRRTGGLGETAHDSVDVAWFHRLGNLAGVHLRYLRWCPQLPLGVRRAALPTRVPERCDQHGAVRVHRVRDRPPTRTAVGGEGSPFVRPVRRMDRRLLRHDHADAPGRPPGVVGHRSRREGPAMAQVGLVRPEQHPARRVPATQREWICEQHCRPQTSLSLRQASLACVPSCAENRAGRFSCRARIASARSGQSNDASISSTDAASASVRDRSASA